MVSILPCGAAVSSLVRRRNSHPAQMRNATGAGDAFMAALAWAYLEGTALAETARAAAAAAAIAIEGEETINPAMSADTVRSRMAAE